MKEQQIEQELVKKLSDLKYIYREDIKDKLSLEHNFRRQFDELNEVTLTNSEFDRLMGKIVTADVYHASQTLREINTLERDDGTPLQYNLVNVKDWCKNNFEVINQLRINTDNSHHVYDVVLLINGVPIAQIELKSLQINPRKAMQQIVEYKNDPGNGYDRTLMCFLQLFIVSNRNDTWYFANNNKEHFSFDADERFISLYQFADKDNKKITHLDSFADKFLAKCRFAQMVSRYMVLVACEKKLMMMRPYQIYAVQAIMDSIHQNHGNGYIWHTTGSGKTLTSFKASTLLKDNPAIEKCLFVVDRKDLDRQTREEFNRFQDGCVEENTNTKALVARLLSDDYADKVIVTTIQKLGLALGDKNNHNYKEQLKPLSNKRVVFIFDECHRSQFGENHSAIRDFFPRAQLFGFTGTPIFDQNAGYQQIKDQQASNKTTKDIFQHQLHAYTITHAIEDSNVLRFHIDYYKPESKAKEKHDPTKEAIVEAILDKHDAATNKRKFNALFATSQINDAIEYTELFKKIQEKRKSDNPEFIPLTIACVFSPPAEDSQDVKQIQEDLPQEKADNAIEPDKKKKALAAIIESYNTQYKTNHSITEFDSYYQDVQKRIKDQQYPKQDLPSHKKIDITIVVDMLLTGFDSKFLNTLYVDKNLKHHGLIQAFSRTNRVLNNTKPFGNVHDFRRQQDKVDEAITLFSGSNDGKAARSIWLVESAPVMIDKLSTAVKTLDDFMQLQGLPNKPEEIPSLKGDAARIQFVHLFKEIQRIKTQLDQYTDLDVQQTEKIESTITQEQLQGFRGMYIGIAQRLKKQPDKNNKPEDPDFELVLFASDIIDYDYIIKLIAGYSQNTTKKQNMTRQQLFGVIASDAKFTDEREYLEGYINSLKTGDAIPEYKIQENYESYKEQEQTKELTAVAKKHQLNTQALHSFINDTLQRNIFDPDAFSTLFTPLNLNWKDQDQKEQAVIQDLTPLLHKRNAGHPISGI